MIKVDISVAVFIYLFISVIVVLALWMMGSPKKGKVVFKKDEDFFRRCQICTYQYIDSRDEEFSKCPQCGSLNKRYPDITPVADKTDIKIQRDGSHE